MTGLFEAIERGDFPCRKLHIQVMPEKDADTCNIHPFDLTKVWTHMDYPRMTREMTISPEELPRSKIPSRRVATKGHAQTHRQRIEFLVDGPQQCIDSQKDGGEQGDIHRTAAPVVKLLLLDKFKRLISGRYDGSPQRP